MYTDLEGRRYWTQIVELCYYLFLIRLIEKTL